ncbi:pilus assembly protein CpaE [Roseovarius sp. TE539]|uniref:AAA family ATPase n=1 Tax=Roseovarius sp. TE539 TaxID=2249812 RepID=UPI000DE13287|nr:AAA family ATPase [Roseovarius sp. TE539]RBI76956.1 pilus assembly protein CpaE [Roseovarius sp. TE539]
MASNGMQQADPSPIIACTISRDVQNFDLLIEDMEAALGESWGDLGFSEALAFFNQPEADTLKFVALAIDETDEADIALLGQIITLARSRGIKVILIAEDVSPAALHQLLRQGADEFVPYPLPENELQAAIERLQKPEPAPASTVAAPDASGEEGVLLGVHGLAGGTGASTLAVNLGWELVSVAAEDPPKVCILDLDLQYGAVATFLDLPRREAVYEMWSDIDSMDDEVFKQALVSFQDKLWVLTAPPEMLPLDMITPEDVTRVLEQARRHFDYVVVDMPSTLVQWSEAVLSSAQLYFVTLEMDMRSAQNTLRFKRALKAEELPLERLRYCLNRAPKFTDLTGRSRVKRMSESLEIGIELQLPDGGRPVAQGGDHGLPLAESAPKNPLRREIAKLAASLHEIGKNDAEAA